MLRIIFILLLVLPAPLCVEGANLREKPYKHHGDSLNWAAAREKCLAHSVDLFIVRNEQDNRMIEKEEGWIGVHRESSTSKWRLATGEIANFTSLEKDEAGKDCVYKEKDKLDWKLLECKAEEKYLCEVEDETMILVQESKTWEEALEHCRSLVTPFNDYDLVSLLTEDDHDYAREKAQKASTDQVWTGLRFLAGQWFWVDGRLMEYQMDDCADDNFCGTVDKNSLEDFQTLDCQEKRNFFCARRA